MFKGIQVKAKVAGKGVIPSTIPIDDIDMKKYQCTLAAQIT